MTVPFEDHQRAIAELCDIWDSDAEMQVAVSDGPRARCSVAFAAGAFRHAHAASVLWANGIYTETGPSARACFEAALMAAWSQQAKTEVVGVCQGSWTGPD